MSFNTKYLIFGRTRNLDSLTDHEFEEAVCLARALQKLCWTPKFEYSRYELEARTRRLRRHTLEKLRQEIRAAQRRIRRDLLIKARQRAS